MSVAGPIRILHVIGAMNRGGAETIVMNLYRHMDRGAIQFDFLVNEERTCDYDAEIAELGGHIYRIPRFKLFNYPSYRRACDEFFEHDDHPVVHGHIGFPAAIYLSCAKKLTGAFTIAHSHAQNYPLSPSQLVFRTVAHRVRGRADYYLACSEQAGLDRFGSGIVNGGSFSVLNNGIDAKSLRFDPVARQRVREELGIDSTAPVFGHVGRLTPVKNHPFLLETFCALHARLPESRLVLVGGGESEHEIRSLASELGISDAIVLAGVRSDVPALLSAFDVFVFPSFIEGFAISAVEAQASGLPCLLSNGVPRLAGVGELAHFFDLAEGVERWASKALELYRQSGTNRSQAYLDAVRAGFDIQDSADWLAELYLSHASRKTEPIQG